MMEQRREQAQGRGRWDGGRLTTSAWSKADTRLLRFPQISTLHDSQIRSQAAFERLPADVPAQPAASHPGNRHPANTDVQTATQRNLLEEWKLRGRGCLPGGLHPPELQLKPDLSPNFR